MCAPAPVFLFSFGGVFSVCTRPFFALRSGLRVPCALPPCAPPTTPRAPCAPCPAVAPVVGRAARPGPRDGCGGDPHTPARARHRARARCPPRLSPPDRATLCARDGKAWTPAAAFLQPSMFRGGHVMWFTPPRFFGGKMTRFAAALPLPPFSPLDREKKSKKDGRRKPVLCRSPPGAHTGENGPAARRTGTTLETPTLFVPHTRWVAATSLTPHNPRACRRLCGCLQPKKEQETRTKNK